MLRRSLMAGMMLALIGFVPLRADTLEDVEKKLQDAHSKLTSYSANTKMTQNIDMGESGSSKSEATGTLEWMRHEGKDLMRTETKISGEQQFGGQSMKIDQKILAVSDGEYVYTLTEMKMDPSAPAEKQCMKNKAEPSMGYDPKSTFDALRQTNTLKLNPDEKVDGMDCYVVEATPTTDIPGYPMVRQLFYLDKKTGMSVQILGFDKENKPVINVRVSDMKVNPGFSPDHFKFTPPEGVPVMDMTKMQEEQPADSQP